MKKGIFYTFNFKGLFSGILVGLFLFSFILMIAFGNTAKTDKTVSKNDEIEVNPTVIIDAGHGGEDGGTASSKGVNEKDINLSVSKKLQMLMSLSGYDIIMTRCDDNLIYDGQPDTMREKKASDIINRMKIIENNPSAIFLSIHQNHFTESKYRGAQVFYTPQNAESEMLATKIQNAIIDNIQNDNTRKIKKSTDDVYLLYNAKSVAVMVECGFMSNPSEAFLLEDESYQLKMAVAIISGTTDYLKGEI